jgi:hypothetical protein
MSEILGFFAFGSAMPPRKRFEGQVRVNRERGKVRTEE